MNRVTICISVLILAAFNLSFRWPVNSSMLTSTFGESRADHFHDGIDLISSDKSVYPLDDGKLLYLWNRALFPLDNYWGGGNYKLISYGNGLVSVYMHLQDGDNLKTSYKKQDKAGMIGNTGHSYGAHLHFSILDIQKRESANPFSVLPSYEDTQPPEIRNLFVKIGERYVMLRDISDIRLTKHYPLLVEARDSISGKERLGVYTFRASFNGRKAADYKFEKIGYGENGLTVNKSLFHDIIDEKGYYIVSGLKFRNGQNTLEVQAGDFNGNQSRKKYIINVELDLND